MRLSIVIKHVGSFLLINSLFLLISSFISIYHHEDSWGILMFSSILCLLLGIFPSIFVREQTSLNIQEGLLIITLGWVLACLTGMLPFYMWGGEFNLINSWFESVSGFTTTGASILTNVEALPKGMLFWRSSTHFIGGIGIIVFTLLIIPSSGKTKFSLLQNEFSNIVKTSLQTRVKNIFKSIVIVYIILNALLIIFLMFAGMDLFDATNHAFATIATGGFSTKNLSIAYYDSVTIEVIIMIFMLISGLNFGLLFFAITGMPKRLFKSPVVQYFLIFIFVGILLASLKLTLDGYGDFWWSLRYASFQVISLASTTGFATIDTPNWPPFVILLLIYFTIQCACAGSTAGGLKFDRVFFVLKSISQSIKLILHPRAIIRVKLGKQNIDEGFQMNVLIFTITYLGILFISTLILNFQSVDLITAFSGAAAALGNVGPGFGGVSSLGNYNALPDFSKFVLSVNMLLGRLEIFPILSILYFRRWN